MIKIRSGKWALCALVLSFVVLYVAFIKCGPTHYAAQYDEGKFNALYVGMSSVDLENVMGAPLERIHQRDGSVLWTYSSRDDVACSFWRRWVYLADDKITSVVSDYWEE
jgi:hypothetical protein